MYCFKNKEDQHFIYEDGAYSWYEYCV